jgi:predicted metal-dependent hydrolase
LMHLERMDHSPRFWKLVAEKCPDHQELRRQLRTNYCGSLKSEV